MFHFVYMWFDARRKMYYVGQHSGNFDDGYVSSSKWLNGEIAYRPADFKKRIIKTFLTKHDSQRYEGYLFTLIKQNEWGKKYYNIKVGTPIGTAPWNKGTVGAYSDEYRQKISNARKGKPTTKGRKNPTAAENGKKGAVKQSSTVTGRKRKFLEDGSWTWEYPNRLVDSVSKSN